MLVRRLVFLELRDQNLHIVGESTETDSDGRNVIDSLLVCHYEIVQCHEVFHLVDKLRTIAWYLADWVPL